MSYKYTDRGRAHLHSYDGKPLMGTSSVCKILGKGDALTWWASGMCAEKFGFLNPNKHSAEAVKLALEEGYDRIMGMEPEEYERLLTEAYKAHDTYKNERAKIGTARHEALEVYVKECLAVGTVQNYVGDNEFVKKFSDWAMINIEKFLWSEMHCYSLNLWVGGIADIGWVDKQARVIAGDFKSSKEAYFDQFVQIAGYDTEISENGGYDADGRKIFSPESDVVGYCVIPFGADDLVPEFQFNVEEYREAFAQAASLYKKSEAFTASKPSSRPARR